jgi:transcriptional regulator with XRE-family HTH domain
MRDFGEDFQALLEERGISLREVARRAGVSPGHLSNVLHGQRPLTPNVATRLDRELGVGDLFLSYALLQDTSAGWHVSAPVRKASAVSGLDGYEAVDDAVEGLVTLTANNGSPRADVAAASGPDLAAAVHDALRAALTWRGHRTGRDRVLQPQLAVMSSHIASMRKLDDRHGGGALSLLYVNGQLRVALDLARAADYTADIGHQLMIMIADLAQLSGWVHFDASRYGAAERYLMLSQYVARAAGEPGRAANAVGMLSYISAFAGHGADAVHIAAAAEYVCPTSASPTLRARIAGRRATACAAAGDFSGFRAASEAALDLLTRCGTEVPSYLYYLEPEQLIAEQGQALVMLAERSEIGRERLLREAIELLAPISSSGSRPQYPRSALLHGSFLAKAYFLIGDLDAAVASARDALTRLTEVQSVRGISYLRSLRPQLARRDRAPVVAEFLPEFDAALQE